ncbi:hypothetical protein Ancab_032097 [Ancistrocladus abbreviatus]
MKLVQSRHGNPSLAAMVVGTLSWLTSSSSSDRKRSKENHHYRFHFRHHHHDKPETLGILAFDAANTMFRLVSLYKTLTDNEINRLREHVLKSRGVLYLNSEDEGFLLTVACAERLEDLDRAASGVARLGSKCSDSELNRFDQVYKDLKLGYVDLDKLNYGYKDVDKVVEKMEKLIASTANLYAELQALSELEVSERKINEFKKNANSDVSQHSNYHLFEQKINSQRKQVRNLKEVSLWNRSFDKSVGLMARVVCVVYAKICNHFGPYVSVLPQFHSKHHQPLLHHHNHQHKSQRSPQTLNLFDDPSRQQTSWSGPIIPQTRTPRAAMVRFLSRDSSLFTSPEDVGFGISTCKDNQDSTSFYMSNHSNKKVFQAAPPTTVGDAGLAVRYANVIMLAERYLSSDSMIGDQERENLYNMLPASLRAQVRVKLRNAWRDMEEEGSGEGNGIALAEGWREAVNGIMEWLGPIAEDTLTWQTESNLEKQRFDARPTVLLIQTLHYSDLEKTEAAIAEVLVGLSCIFWFENRRLVDLDG